MRGNGVTHALKMAAMVLIGLLAMMMICARADAQNTVWYNDHAKIIRPLRGFWAPGSFEGRDGFYTIRANLVLDRGYCMNVDRRGAFVVKVKSMTSGEVRVIRDDGVMVREGATQFGWKDTLIEGGPIQISWNDDDLLRQNARQRFPDIHRPVPVRVLIYLKVLKALGGGELWHIVTIAPLAKWTETVKCD